MSKEQVKRIDKIAKRFNMSRSEAIETGMEIAEDHLKMLDSVGLKPERLAKVINTFKAVQEIMPDLEKAGLLT